MSRTRTLRTGGFPSTPDKSWSRETLARWADVAGFAARFPSNAAGGWHVQSYGLIWSSATWVATWPLFAWGILASWHLVALAGVVAVGVAAAVTFRHVLVAGAAVVLLLALGVALHFNHPSNPTRSWLTIGAFTLWTVGIGVWNWREFTAWCGEMFAPVGGVERVRVIDKRALQAAPRVPEHVEVTVIYPSRREITRPQLALEGAVS